MWGSVFQPRFLGTHRYRQFNTGFPENPQNSTILNVYIGSAKCSLMFQRYRDSKKVGKHCSRKFKFFATSTTHEIDSSLTCFSPILFYLYGGTTNNIHLAKHNNRSRAQSFYLTTWFSAISTFFRENLNCKFSEFCFPI